MVSAWLTYLPRQQSRYSMSVHPAVSHHGGAPHSGPQDTHSHFPVPLSASLDHLEASCAGKFAHSP